MGESMSLDWSGGEWEGNPFFDLLGVVWELRFSIMYLISVFSIFYLGWFVWPQTSPCPDTHLWGLRFMPACTPFGANEIGRASCRERV